MYCLLTNGQVVGALDACQIQTWLRAAAGLGIIPGSDGFVCARRSHYCDDENLMRLCASIIGLRRELLSVSLQPLCVD
jgi:hypothetical protein